MKTGTLKNVASFEKLVGICNDLGARYNPSKSELSSTALSVLLEQAHNSIEEVDNAHTNFVNAVNQRQASFAQLNPLAVRIIRALVASGASAETMYDAYALKRKLNTARSSAQPVVNPAEEGSTVQKSGVISYQDFENRASIFSQLVKLLQSTAEYAPNEPELQLPALKAYMAELRERSHTVMVTGNALSNARDKRNKTFTGKGSVHAIGTAVKAYIRSLFGLRSYPATELAKLRLTN